MAKEVEGTEDEERRRGKGRNGNGRQSNGRKKWETTQRDAIGSKEKGMRRTIREGVKRGIQCKERRGE